MSQTVYSIAAGTGYAGDLYDAHNLFAANIYSRPAAETIPFGVLLEEQVGGTVRVWRGTGKVAGFSMRRATRMGGAYAPSATSSFLQGEEVAIVRSGRMRVQLNSTAAGVAHAAFNVWIPSDNSATNLSKLGTVTSQATSSSTGAEIGASPSTGTFWLVSAIATGGIAVVAFNYGP